MNILLILLYDTSANNVDFSEYIAIMLWVVFAIFIIYSLGNFYLRGRIITTEPVFKENIIKADQYYFLPSAILNITATTKIIVTRSAIDNSFQSADTFELAIETAVQIQADSRQLYALKYHPSPFMTDELKITTNTSGLLDTINLSTEDRISNLITGITEAPKKILSGDKPLPFITDLKTNSPAVTKQILGPFIKSFVLYADDLEKTEFVKRWEINIEDASNPARIIFADLQFKIEPPNTMFDLQNVKKNMLLDGILTRPLHNLHIKVYTLEKKDNEENTNYKQEPDLSFEVTVPDISKLINIPIKRAPFIKIIHTPKFSSGLLIENYINKPSEAEGFLSIPINVGKAIFSIPAQLLSFKVEQVKKEPLLQTENKKVLASPTHSIPKNIAGSEQLQKDKLNSEQSKLATLKSKIDNENELLDVQNKLLTAKKELQGLLQNIKTEKEK